MVSAPGSAATEGAQSPVWTNECPWVAECHEHGFLGAFKNTYLAGKCRDRHYNDAHGVVISIRYKPTAAGPE